MYKPITDVSTEPLIYITMRFLVTLEMGGGAGSILFLIKNMNSFYLKDILRTSEQLRKTSPHPERALRGGVSWFYK